MKRFIAVSRSNLDTNNLLFSGSGREPTIRAELDLRVQEKCQLLTRGQRCADGFILGQLTMTGTVAGVLLLSIKISNRHLVESVSTQNTVHEIMKLLVGSWFSSAISTEHMMRGKVNEEHVLLEGK